jgi:hypothetical protein
MLLGAPNEDNYSRSSISSSMVVERSRFGGDESANYVVPDDVTVDILSSIQMHFGLVSKRWILRHVQCFGLAVGFAIRGVRGKLLGKNMMEKSGRILCIFISDFFHM